jgi:SAM-dependent methyltransferase
VSDVFGSAYAGAYDLLYRDKDYAGECDLIEHLFQRYDKGAVSHVLDLGCGTGNHAFLLASRGYNVVGVERSEHMIALAERRLSQSPNGATPRFERGDIRQIDLGRRFDAALILFAVLGYQLENRDVLSTLKAARRHLRRDALLIFDVWYGPAVLHMKPSTRVQLIPAGETRILRVGSGRLDIATHTCTVRYQLWTFVGERVSNEIEESHQMRYFFPRELDLFLETSGFCPVRLGAFPDFDREPNETTWNVIGVARAV